MPWGAALRAAGRFASLRPRRGDNGGNGGVAERLKAHAWKVCMGATPSRVRIPLPPPPTHPHPSMIVAENCKSDPAIEGLRKLTAIRIGDLVFPGQSADRPLSDGGGDLDGSSLR